jgi:hypothetical protein
LIIKAVRNNLEIWRAAQAIERVAKEAGWKIDPIGEEPYDTRFLDGVTCVPSSTPETEQDFNKSYEAARAFCGYLRSEKWEATAMTISPDNSYPKAVQIVVSQKPSSIFLSSTLEKDLLPISSMDRHLGPEPKRFKGKRNEDIGQMLVQEAGTIDSLSRDAMREDKEFKLQGRERGSEVDAELSARFKDCCMDAIRDLRIEAYRRLNSTTMNDDEDTLWNQILEGIKYGRRLDFMTLGQYSKELYKLGQRVEATK